MAALGRLERKKKGSSYALFPSSRQPAVTIGDDEEGEGEAADYSVKIVGESYRQDALEEICGGRDTESANLTATARLVREDDNAHDDRAVKVVIQGRHVGWRRSSL